MKNRSAKALVAALAGAGALVGVGAAIVWHLAVPGATESAQLTSASDHSSGYSGFGIQIAHVRPDWFPSSLYFVGAGILVGLILSSFLVDAGIRVRADRQDGVVRASDRFRRFARRRCRCGVDTVATESARSAGR